MFAYSAVVVFLVCFTVVAETEGQCERKVVMNEGDYNTLGNMGVRMAYMKELVSYRRMGFIYIENEDYYRVEPGCSNLTLTLWHTDCIFGDVHEKPVSESSLIRTYVVSIRNIGRGAYLIDLVYQFLLSDYECYYELRTRLGYYFKDGKNIPTLLNNTVPFMLHKK